MDERLSELQKEVSLKGFRPGKVPPAVIKSQFGKSVYGEVIDKVLRETSTKAISEQKLKIAGQPKIDLKQFGEGKDLNYELQIDCLPNIKLNSLEQFKATNYKIKIENKSTMSQLAISESAATCIANEATTGRVSEAPGSGQTALSEPDCARIQHA